MFPAVVAGLIIILINFNSCNSAQRASIHVPPVSVNISRDGVARINCTAIANFIDWEANGKPIDSFRSKGFDDTAVSVVLNETQNLRMATLKVVGSSNSNNVSVVCVALVTNSDHTGIAERSTAALILVQGLLDAVDNLTVTTITSTTVLISWKPPFTLEGVPILGYNVVVTGSVNKTMFVENPTLPYTINHPNIESNLTVTVVPLNRAGEGQAASVIVTLRLVPVLASSQVFPGGESTLSELISPSPLMITHTSMAANAKTGLPRPATEVVIAVVTPLTFIVAVLVFTSTCALIVFIFRRQAIKRATSATVQDVVVVLDNPAYEDVKKRQIQLQENSAYEEVKKRQIQLQENSAYGVVVYSNPAV